MNEAAALPVVAVVVTCDPGWWLEEALSALVAQDYPNLSLLVIDAASGDDPTARVAAVAPSAYVRRTARRSGFGAAANEALTVVEGASHFLFCHDDVAPAPDALRLMVAEALRENAGIVSPKVVAWSAPDRLLAAGAGADAFGVVVPLVERGELDQRQHDAVREVFVAPAACTLVRADLFATLGGFDPAVGLAGEDLELCWRARIAGARVVLAPGAVVRHAEVTGLGLRSVDGSLASLEPTPAAAPMVEPEAAATVEEATVELSGRPLRRPHIFGRHGARRAPDSGAQDERTDPWSIAPGDEEGFGFDLRPRRHHRGARAPIRAPIRAPKPRPGALGLAPAYGLATAELERHRTRARVRAVVTNYGLLGLARVLPAMWLLTLARAAGLLLSRRPVDARAVFRPWRAVASTLVGRGGVVAKRRAVRSVRRVPDRVVRRAQLPGNVHLRTALRESIDRGLLGPAPDWVVPGAVWAGLAVVLVAGSRKLLGGTIPSVGELAPFPALGTLAAQMGSGWRLTGLGAAVPAPTLFGILTALGAVLLGHMALLEHLVVLGCIPVGVAGIAHLARPFGSRRVGPVAAVAYAANPLAWNALARGRWSGLVAFAAFPWVFSVLARAGGLAPLDPGALDPGALDPGALGPGALDPGALDPGALDPGALGQTQGPATRIAWTTGRRVVAFGLILAAAAAVAPSVLLVALAAGLALGTASLVTGDRGAARRVGLCTAGGTGVAAVLLFPWSVSFLPPWGEWARLTGVAPAPGHTLSLPALLAFRTGPLGAGPLGWMLLAAAAFPLVVARSWRLSWATRWWVVAFWFFALSWVWERGWIGAPAPPLEVLLAPAAVAVALAVSIGLAAFETDLRDYHFGWPQALSTAAAAAFVLACLPVLGAAGGGRWHMPAHGFDDALSWLADKRSEGGYRVLWLGDPAVLPLPGWRYRAGLAYATTRDGPPDLTSSQPGPSRGATRLIPQALRLAASGQTTQLGHLLAPMAVRYIVGVIRPAPLSAGGGGPGAARLLPADLTDGLAAQLDLRPLPADGALVVFENVAWSPMRALLDGPAATAAAGQDPSGARSAGLAGSPPVLASVQSPTSFAGSLPGGVDVLLAEASSPRWRLTSGKQEAARSAAFGFANLFRTSAPGAASLSYRTPPGEQGALVLTSGAWMAAVMVVVTGRRRRVGLATRGRAPGGEQESLGAPVVSATAATSAADHHLEVPV